MQTIQTVFDTQIEQVRTSPASLFTKDDVCNLLSDFEKRIAAAQSQLKGLEDLKNSISQQYQEEIEDTDSDQLIDFDSAEFSIGYDNRIEIDSIDINKDAIMAKFNRVLDNIFNQYQKN